MSEAHDARESQLMPDREWIRNTLAALGGAATVLVAVVLAFGDVRRNATDALKQNEEIRTELRAIANGLEVRVRTAETTIATQHSEIEQFKTSLREVRDDVKELLRRVPPK